jgi:hypothetical protein
MNNNENLNREIENLLTAYMNELFQPRATPSVPTPVPVPLPTTVPDERITHRRYYNIVSDIIHDYNTNMQLYQENMRDLIRAVSNGPPAQPAQIPLATTTTLFSYFLQPLQPAATTPGLSVEQIEQHTSMVSYNAEMNEVRCPICLEDFENGEQVCKINACGHFFKRTGLMRWFERNTHCPVCRCDVLNVPLAASNVPASNVPASNVPASNVPGQSARRTFGPEPPPTTGVPLFTQNPFLQQAFSNLQAPLMNEVNTFLRNLGNNLDASFNEVD